MLSDPRGIKALIKEYKLNGPATDKMCISKIEASLSVRAKMGLGVSDATKDKCFAPSGLAISTGFSKGIRKVLANDQEEGEQKTCKLTDWTETPLAFSFGFTASHFTLDSQMKYVTTYSGKEDFRRIVALRFVMPFAVKEKSFAEIMCEKGASLGFSVVYQLINAAVKVHSAYKNEKDVAARREIVSEVLTDAVMTILAATKTFFMSTAGGMYSQLFPADPNAQMSKFDLAVFMLKAALEAKAGVTAVDQSRMGLELTFVNTDDDINNRSGYYNVRLKMISSKETNIDGEAFGAFFSHGTYKDIINTNVNIGALLAKLPGPIQTALATTAKGADTFVGKMKNMFTNMENRAKNMLEHHEDVKTALSEQEASEAGKKKTREATASAGDMTAVTPSTGKVPAKDDPALNLKTTQTVSQDTSGVTAPNKSKTEEEAVTKVDTTTLKHKEEGENGSKSKKVTGQEGSEIKTKEKTSTVEGAAQEEQKKKGGHSLFSGAGHSLTDGMFSHGKKKKKKKKKPNVSANGGTASQPGETSSTSD